MTHPVVPPGSPAPTNAPPPFTAASQPGDGGSNVSSAAEDSFAQKLIARLIGIPVAIVVSFGLWWLLFLQSEEFRPGSRAFPSPTGAFGAFGELFRDVSDPFSFTHVGGTVGRVVLAFVIALLLGSLLGGIVGINRWTRGIFDPLLNSLRFVSPAIAVTISFLSSGFESNKALPTALPAIFVVADGVSRAISRRSVDSAKVRVNEIVNATRTALLVTWLAVSITELHTGRTGIFALAGARARNFLQTDILGAALIATVVLALIMDTVIRVIGYLIARSANAE